MEPNQACVIWAYATRLVLGGLTRPTQTELMSFVMNAPLQSPHGAAYALFTAACAQARPAAAVLGLAVNANFLAVDAWQDRKRKTLH